MDVITKFLDTYNYKFKSGYFNPNDKEDLLLLERILDSLKLEEGTKAANTRKAIDIIINSDTGKENKLTKMSNEKRIGNKAKIDKDKFIEIINQLFNSPKLTIHSPKEGPNSSSKFNMFEFELEDEGLVQITLAGGANEGEKYEQDLLAKMQGSAGRPMDEIEFPDILDLFNKLGINSEDITPDDIEFMGSADTKRQLSFDGPVDMGPNSKDEKMRGKVADVVIKTDPLMYISIKNMQGSGIYNGGNLPFIVYDENGKVVFDKNKYGDNKVFKEIFEAAGIDPQRLADGLDVYTTQKGSNSEWETPKNIDLSKLKKLLASSFGYNYWYVREKPGGKIFVHYIDGPSGA